MIEMREVGEIVHQRQPFDWILFNKLIKRPHISSPKFHGNYNNSLSLVHDMILEEHRNLFEAGAEQREIPNFFVVFLSDGKPSDCNPSNVQERNELLSSLAGTLKSKLCWYAMGIGAKGADFGALTSMVETVKVHGGQGRFVHAG